VDLRAGLRVKNPPAWNLRDLQDLQVLLGLPVGRIARNRAPDPV
jgi:hypothetical protein